jgi:hypothetical protein
MPCQLATALRPWRRFRREDGSSRPCACPVPPKASLHATETNAKANAHRAHVARKHSNPARAVARADATARDHCPWAPTLLKACMVLQVDKMGLVFGLQIDRMSNILSLQIDKIGHIYGLQIDKPQV